MSAALTLGAEEELHLIDLERWQLAARAPQVLSKLPRDGYTAEIQRTTVETNTAVVSTLDGLRQELLRLRRGLVDVAGREGLGIAAVGTAPRSEFRDFELTATGRYGRMQEQYRLLVDEQLICGTQVHVGVEDRDQAVEIMQRIARWLPVLLALSASSPYLNGQDTGYASIRTIIWQRWPSAGATGYTPDAAAYDQVIADLIASGVIADAKMAYFDVRPSSHAPTLELRIADACPLVDDAVLIAGLFRAMVRAAEKEIEAGELRTIRALPVHRAAIWQAARGGLAGRLLDDSRHPRPIPAPDAVRALVERLREELEELGDLEEVREMTELALARGNSADRQRSAFAEEGDLADVMRSVVEETQGPPGGAQPASIALRRYRARAGDEGIDASSRPRRHYTGVVDWVRGLGEDEVRRREERRDAWSIAHDFTFGVDGQQRPFDVDLVPRLIQPHEWTELEAGLIQRARAIEAFLDDVYGEQRIIADGVLDDEIVRSVPGWREEARRLPPTALRAPIQGFDLVRNEYGGWRVLEDNVRCPSGAAYAMSIRQIMDAVVPDMPRPDRLADPASALEQLRRTILAGAKPGTRGALLSDGPSSSAWYEHRMLADGAGLLLAVPDDLDVVDGFMVHRPTGNRIGSFYVRLDDQVLTLTASDGRPIGEEIMDTAAAGRLLLKNAPGNGVADDKAMYRAVPELIGYYLRERPLLESVPTYRLADEAERRGVLERVGELVTKPVDGSGGRGVLIGPSASATELADRRHEIAEHPEAWVAQEVVQLSSVPSVEDGLLQPRHVDLRAFVYTTGHRKRDWFLADLGLTRVAPEGSLVVNSSRGGGAKDTWIVLPEHQHGHR
ncbi:glutamate--cysteine ligase [Amnibacterium endophyticum]|uniref:Putative glutamate--cysteine ligase 2 n=1 Tax=Amnibacterium endophyticum TaxID=2109337 RepID=A0ABW4LBY9_9MICO